MARARSLGGAIAVNPKRRTGIAGRRIVLVDDVLTSGATSDACVGALLRAGADSVRIACFARVLDEVLHGNGTSIEPESGIRP
jgi:predicted amidophosphoribosyltransferase